MNIGENIRSARDAKKMSQLALAHAIGWRGPDAGAQICRFEHNQKEPRVATLIKIAKALDVDVDVLVKNS